MDTICTVLLISYNHAQYISKCIESVLTQKTNYKFIIKIFDDASDDGTQDIIREYAAKYPDKIEVHLNEKNLGAQTNIWNAYKSVNTKYCILTETDDYWCDDLKLEIQIKALEENPKCSFCCTNNIVKVISDKYLKFKDGKKEIQPHIFSKNIINWDYVNNLETGFYTHISTRLLRSECMNLEHLKNKESFLFDSSQFLYMLTKGDMYWIDKVSSVYVKTGAGTCTSSDVGRRLGMFLSAMSQLNEDTDYKIWRKIVQQINFVTNVWIMLDEQQNGKTVSKQKNSFFSRIKRFLCVLRINLP